MLLKLIRVLLTMLVWCSLAVNAAGGESTKPAAVDVKVKGELYYRPLNKPDAEWNKLMDMPGSVPIEKGRALKFKLALSGRGDFISGARELATVPGLTHLVLANGRLKDADLSVLEDFGNLVSLDLSYNEITNEGLPHIAKLENLQELKLAWNFSINGEGLKSLKAMKELRHLDLTKLYMFRDADLAVLGELDSLETLILSWCTNVSDAGIASLAKLRRLRHLKLSAFENITDKAAASIAGLEDLEYLDLYRCGKITDKGFKGLGRLRKLKKLCLRSCGITGKALAHFKELQFLEELDINCCQGISEEDLALLEVHKGLKTLKVGFRDDLTNSGMVHIGKLEYLTVLDLSVSSVPEDGLAHLKGLGKLKILKLDQCKNITGNSLEHVGVLSSLEELSLLRCKLSEKGLAHLAKLENLRKLTAGYSTGITDKGMVHIVKIHSLRILNLPAGGGKGDLELTDDGLRHITDIQNLETLSLWGRRNITDAAIGHIQALSNLGELSLGGTSITDAGLSMLHKMKSLRIIELGNCRSITRDGVQELKRALPKCQVNSKFR